MLKKINFEKVNIFNISLIVKARMKKKAVTRHT